jgi:hypothetical protein
MCVILELPKSVFGTTRRPCGEQFGRLAGLSKKKEKKKDMGREKKC